ncbi:MAG: sugar nucleotide-binding protein [Deltaproteobacteria bacterium]|nr:sugar nucleotide-binding protein [Deltaproteobacteria bacterium]
MPTAFLFGATSMLGWSIWQARAATPFEVVGFCNASTRHRPDGISRAIDLDDADAVRELFAREQPALVVNCAGVCDVEMCERSPAFAWDVNVRGTAALVAHAPPTTRLVHCSSDHVFGGDAGPYAEDSPTAPISVYGRSRVAAEAIALARPDTVVVRAGLWIGPSATGRIGHLDWLRHRHQRGLPMTVVRDEVRSAVWADDAARRVWAIAAADVTGVRHVTATAAIARPALAAYLIDRFAIGAQFAVEDRAARRAPHLGRVELATRYADALAAPLPAVVPAS